MTTAPSPSAGRAVPQPDATSGTMRAIVQHVYGTADSWTVDQVDRPTIKPTEVLVRVHAAGLDRGTWHLMAGLPYAMRLGLGFRGPKATVPGRDLSGVV